MKSIENNDNENIQLFNEKNIEQTDSLEYKKDENIDLLQDENIEQNKDENEDENIEQNERTKSKNKKRKTREKRKRKKLKKWQIITIACLSILVVAGIAVGSTFLGIYLNASGGTEVSTSEVADFKRMENIVATHTINGSAVDNFIKISELLPEANASDVTISNSSTAEVDGEYIKIHNIGTFHIVVGEAVMEYRVVDGYNVNSADEIVMASIAKEAIVLQSDIIMVNVQDLPSANEAVKISESVILYKSLYGNGYIIDASHRIGSTKSSVLFNVRAKDVNISNVHIIGSNPIPEEGKSVVFDDYTIGGNLILYTSIPDTRYPLEGDVASGKIEYSVLERAQKLVQIAGADVQLKGNILLGAGDACVSVQATLVRQSDIVMEDNIIIDPQIAGVLFWKTENTENNVQGDKFAKLTIKGRFDVYNWKNEETAAVMPASEGLSATIVNGVIREALLSDDFDDMLIKKYDHKWVHLGIVVVSSSEGENKPEITGYNKKGIEYEKGEFPIPSSLNNIVGKILRTKDIYGYSTTDFIDPLADKKVNENMFKSIWGDLY